MCRDRGHRPARTQKIWPVTGVAVEVDPDLPTLNVDPVLFEQVLVNLLDNAAKYAPRGLDRDSPRPARRRAVRIEVLDEGFGLPDGDVERVFDKFYRVRKCDHVRAGNRARPRDLPGVRRGDGRHRHRGQPSRPAGGRLHT